jgi:hypothetical protein|tara:strand:+ start:1257 stop:3428 length:2172 start_codon:yes stop_codon:yes gene_type:complete
MAHTDHAATGSPVSSLTKAPKTEEDLNAFMEDVWTYVSVGRLGLEYRIKEAIHFLAGDQWVRYIPHSQKFAQHTLDEWVPTPTTNYLVKYFDRIVDLFTSGDLVEIVDPATKDQEDVESASAALRMLRAEFLRLKTETELYTPAAGWLLLAGSAVLSATWNGRAGKKIKSPKMTLGKRDVTKDILECKTCGYKEEKLMNQVECPRCGDKMVPAKTTALDMSSGRPIQEKYETQAKDKKGNGVYDEFSVGEVEERVCNILNWYPQPVKRWKDTRYVVETDPMDLDQIRSIWGSKAADVVGEDLEVTEWQGVYNTSIQAYSGLQKERGRDHSMVKFLRHIPDKRWPDGLLLITAGGKVLHKGKLDSCDDKLPYEFIKYREVPGMFWGQSLFSDLIQLQKRVNAIDSHIVQNRKQMVSSQWLVPEGSAISHIDGRSGLIIRWSPSTTAGFKPEKMMGTPVSQQVLNEREQTINDMEEVSGAREILQGGTPPGPETGAAIERLQEQAFRRFKPAIGRWRRGLSDHAKRKLQLIDKYWDEPRMVRTQGENKDTESEYLSKANLQNAEDMEIRVSVGLDFSDSSKRDRITKALGSGLLGDPNSPEVRGKVLSKLGIEGFDSEYILDAKKARRALQAIQKSEPPPEILEVDNHVVQFQIFRDHMMTTEFEGAEPTIKEAIQARAMEHKQFMQQAQMATMQAAEATKGAGPGAEQAVADSGAMGGPVPVQQ